MERLVVKAKKLDPKEVSLLIDEVLANKISKDFFDESNLILSDIEENFVSFSLFLEDNKKCLGCKGLKDCPRLLKGYCLYLVLNRVNNVDCVNGPCSYYYPMIKMKENYFRKDFDDELLSLRLTKEEGEISGRLLICKTLANIMNNAAKNGVFIYGKSGVGKSYLAICFANRIVERGRKVAYLDMRTFSSDMRDLIYQSKEAFVTLLEEYKKIDTLFIDNLGDEQITAWVRDDLLFEILETRKKAGLINTIIISKYNYEELSQLYGFDAKIRGKRLMNTISDYCLELELTGLNRYKK